MEPSSVGLESTPPHACRCMWFTTLNLCIYGLSIYETLSTSLRLLQRSHEELHTRNWKEEMTPHESPYQNKPMLRLLDAYVLDAIGLLDKLSISACEAISCRLKSALWVDAGKWQEAVELPMDTPTMSRDEIRTLWPSEVDRASTVGEVPNALTFVWNLVDINFDPVAQAPL